MYENLYEKGIAVGHANVRTDTMTFRWKDELFEFPTLDVFYLTRYNGYWYEAKVRSLRRLRKSKEGRKNGIHKSV